MNGLYIYIPSPTLDLYGIYNYPGKSSIPSLEKDLIMFIN